MFQTEDGGIHRNIYPNAVDLGFSFRLRTAQRTFSYCTVHARFELWRDAC